MNKSVLLEQIKKFTPKEIKEFGEFVNSPFFNKNQSVVKLFEYLRSRYPDFEGEKLEKEYVHEQIFPKADYNDGFMRTIMFNLSELAENYLAYQGFKSKPFAEKRYLLHELNERNLNKQVERSMKEVVKKFADVQVLDSDYYYNKFILDYEYFYYLTRQHRDRTEKIVKMVDIENLFNHLTYYYLIHTLKLYIYYLNTKSIFRIEFKTELIEHIINNLKPEFYTDIPSINIFYHILMLHINESETANFYKVKELAANHEDKLLYDDIIEIYINLENYCRRMIRKGRKEFTEELFEIYQTEIEKEFYRMQGSMPFKFYRSVVDTALRLKKNAWAKEFIEKRKNELSPDDRENFYLYSLALYEFAERNFEKVLELLSKVTYSEIYHKTEMKCLLAAAYYELGHTDALLAHLDSFRHFLSNDKVLPPDRKEYYSVFMKLVKNLCALKEKNDYASAMQLEKKIDETAFMYNKEWLLDKVRELIKK